MDWNADRPDPADTSETSGHLDETVQAIARLHAAHSESATRAERALERVMAFLGRPFFAGILTIFLAVWIGTDLWLAEAARKPFDPVPFPMLAIVLSVVEVYMMAVVLIVQRHAQRMENRREQLMLQLALFSDRKTAKLIALLEELRRDDPLVRNRADGQAEELTKPADPEAVLEAIRESSRPGPEDRTAEAMERANGRPRAG